MKETKRVEGVDDISTADYKKYLKRQNGFSSFMKIIYKNKQSFIGMIILLMFVLMATIGTNVINLDMTTNFENRYLPPSFAHLLGTDYVGRDLFAQLVHGSRDVLVIGAAAALFSIFFGFVIGAVAGLVGGWVETTLMFITNLFLTIPSFPVTLILTAFIKVSHPLVLAFIISIFSWAGFARSIRAQILSFKQRDYIIVCKMMNLSLAHIIFKEMLPNIVSYIAIQFISTMQGAIVTSVGLMMMGFAPFSPTHWGTILNMAVSQTAGAFEPKTLMYLFSPIACFILLQMGCIFFAHGIDEALNPRLRR